MQITAWNSTVMYMNSKLLSFRSDAMKQTNTSRLYVPWHVLRCFQKRIFFFLHLAFPAHVTVFSGAGLWKRVPEWRFVKTPEFRFHVDGRKRIFEYKMSYILQPRSTLGKLSCSAIIILWFSCSWARMIWQAYVYIYGYFSWRKIETRKVSFFKKKKKKNSGYEWMRT